jgi:hypothetical protein
MTPAEEGMMKGGVVKVRRLTSQLGCVGQRRAVVVVTSLLLCVAVVLVAREEDAKRAGALASERVVSIQSAVARSTDSNGMNATIAQPSFFEKFMQRLLDLNFNSTKKKEEGKDEEKRQEIIRQRDNVVSNTYSKIHEKMLGYKGNAGY